MPNPKSTGSGTVPARQLSFDLSTSTILRIVGVGILLYLLIKLTAVILMLVAALVIVGTLNPVVEWLEARHLSRNKAIALVFVLLLILALLVVAFTVPALFGQIIGLIDQEPALRARLVKFLSGYKATATFAESLRNQHYDAWLAALGSMAAAASGRILESLAYTVGSVFLALYIMVDRDRLRGGLFALVPRSHHIRLARVMLNLEVIVGAYMRGQALTCLLMWLFLFVLLLSMGVPDALAISVFGGIVDIFPYIGGFLTIAPAVAAALVRGPLVAGIVFLMIVLYEEFESRVLVPLVYGKALRLPTSIVFLALTIGGVLLGVVGALLALPCAAAMLMLVEELRVELPGETEQVADVELRTGDDRVEREYESLTENLPAEKAAAVAVELSSDRKKEEADLAAIESEAGGPQGSA